MDDYIRIPLDFNQENNEATLRREPRSRKEMLDRLLEMIVFTPRGSFSADPDFGFEYANSEYANVAYRDFNNEQNYQMSGKQRQVTKQECEKSIRESLETYAPCLKVTGVSMEINPADIDRQMAVKEGRRKKKVYSRSVVTLSVDGYIKEEDRDVPWHKDLTFLMEPTARRYV